MKLKVWSDLHLEFRNNLFDHLHFEDPADKETTLLLAGDISTGMGAKGFVEEMCKHFKHVLMIHGNHEYYNNDVEKTVQDWVNWELEGAPKNFHFLNNDTRIIDGVRFIGGTMWTSFNNGDPIIMSMAFRMMNDYHVIKNHGMAIGTDFILAEHNKFMEFLKTELHEKFNGKTVVMTHHSPGHNSRSVNFSGDKLNDCYFADQEKLIGEHTEIALWVHGHTHDSFDYMINETRIVGNPYGYWGHAVNPTFDRRLIVEV